MKKIITLCIVCVFALSLVACGAASDGGPGFSGDPSEGGDIVDTALGRKIVYTVNIEIESADVSAVRNKITEKNSELGGYIGNSSEIYDDGKCIGASITYRVPTDKLDVFLDTIEGQGGIESKSIYTTDITTSYVSADAKRSALAEKKTLLEGLLENDGVSATERVSIISEISEVNAEILALDLQIKEYDSMVNYSTVHLRISERFDPTILLIIPGAIALVVAVIIIAEKMRKRAKSKKTA